MHVRIAWEIYYHQNKQNADKSAAPGSAAPTPTVCTVNPTSGGVPISSQSATSVVSAPPPPQNTGVTLAMKSNPSGLSLSSASPHMLHRQGELPPSAAYASGLPTRSPFEASPLSTSFIGAPPSHIGTAVSPFGRYVGPFGFTGLSPFAREMPLNSSLHDPWRLALQRSVPPYHPAGAVAWSQLKPDPALDSARREAEEREREREMREREQRERQRREREERERKEKEEKLKREQQEREREREQREQRERERKERERREMERRELERERMLQQQRINENQKLSQAQAMSASPRDRSPHRSVSDMAQMNPNVGGPQQGDIRIKEEPHPRTKEEQDAMIMRASAAAAAAAAADPRYHPSLAAAHHASFMASRHGPHVPPPPYLTRTMLAPTLGGPPMTHFGPPGPPAWALDPYRDPYAPMLRYNPLMEALRHEEEKHKAALSMYAAQSAAHLRAKEPSPIPPPSVGGPLGPPPPVGPPSHHRIQASPLSGQGPPHTPPGNKGPQMVGLQQQSHGHGMTMDGMHVVPKKEASDSMSPGGAPTSGR